MSSKLNYWAVHYEKWKTSGLKQSDFCKQNNLKYHTFCYWRDRVRKQAMELPSQTKPFLPVKVVHPEAITPKHPNNLIKAAIQITLPSGIAVDIHNHADASLVCQMLKMFGGTHA